MVGNPLDARPPDDTGSDTLQRFRYQACLAIPYCLACAAGEGVTSVIMEHFEDILVEYPDRWFFIQVKTRDARLGPWQLSHAMNGLKSLYRAYKHIEQLQIRAEYSLHLEGPVAARNVLEELVPEKPATLSDKLRENVAKGLEVTGAECDPFLAVTTVRPDQPPRDHVENQILETFSRYAPGLTRMELEAVHQAAINMVLAAMARDRLGSLIPNYIKDATALREEPRSQVEAKRLTRERLVPVMEPVITGGFLLRQQTTMSAEATKLEQKLVAAGADPSMIEDAQMLRSNASRREYVCLSTELYDNAQMDDVQHRLRVLAHAVIARHRMSTDPAAQAWLEVLRELQTQVADLDRHRVYLHDPYLLMGAVCGLTDECRVNWGAPVA